MRRSKRFHLGRLKAFDFLDELAATEGKAISLYLPQGTTQDRVENLLRKVFPADAIPSGMAEATAGSKTGAAFFWSPPQIYLVLPPFPIAEEYVTNGYDVEPLRSLLGHDFLIALVLVRLGAYSIGICRGTELMDSKTGTGLVHARHKKGGSSQARFARHREKQIEQFLIRVCGHVREHIEPHARLLDYLVYGGARTTILSLRKRCPFLTQFDDRILRMLLDIPEPRKAVLEKAVGTVWSTDVIEWCDDSS
ncbi:MAG: Vms1/Ankzf1 family peptidyl-tRNA hydrolase [Dehalococcoidia bacterium]|nr:Vms1/Ankzf1 family peptidyl-tRNA hydrolase [Dehalococcoidia bacterium]MDH4291642.1 Vms1/Ankzf1 family peptidyl-tRNA hydrolase [Dehalococcoidia bacterium]